MKKLFSIRIYIVLLLLLIWSSLYSYFVLQNTWIFIFLFRIVFPLIITFAIFLSHKIYHSKENVANLLSWWLLIIPWWLLSLFFVMGLKLPWLGILLPFFLSILLVVILDISIRWGFSKILIKMNPKTFIITEIKSKWIYYGILAMIYSITIGILTVIF